MTQSDFLKKCQQSSQEAYKAYKELLTKLEDPESRSSALEFAHQLADHLSQKLSPEQMNQRYHSSWINLSLRQGNGGTTQLKLLQLPSTFAPEEWSFTFFEGLARYKRGEFQDRTITELGCGIGWISIALAQQTYPQKIFGLDINPKAILCSKINLYINSFDHKGQSTWNSRGRTLNEVVEFHQSDLLEFCRTNKIAVDRVIGCIPQVLNPDPEFSHRVSARKTLEQANDEFLYSLSNYTADQGYIEDQFGLGLIARAVEESVDVLKISGKIVLNLGGRPGSSVLSHLFSRRGFNVRPIWQTQVTQAKDTDIRSLVRIEEKTRHRFEFYMGFGTSTSVSAKTALAYAEAGGEISHGLTVYEAQLRDPIHLPPILQFMRQPGHEEARKVIDLSYPEDSLALEKMSYLHALSEHLQDGSFFPYESTSGILRFRERLATYFNSYYHSPLTASHFLVAPARSSLIQNILSSFRPKRALVDSQLASQITSGAEIYETPRNLDLLCELLEKLRPEVAIYSISPSEAESRESFLRVCEVAENTGTRLFFDISELIELSSAPKSNGIFRHLADEALPAHVSLICGLVKNQLYRDLEVCFMISENSDLLEILESAAELTYSRTPVLSQLYYDRILQELINFQIIGAIGIQAPPARKPEKETSSFRSHFIKISGFAKKAYSHPAIEGEAFARSPGLIRLDYGENCLPAPSVLQKALFEAFAKMHFSADESDCRKEILDVATNRFNFEVNDSIKITPAHGVAPLFAEIAAYCATKNATLIFPSGSYGHFVASAQFHGARTVTLSTQKKNHFKVSPKDLDQALSKEKKQAWLILTAPTVNPTGSVYNAKELEKIFQVAEKHQAVVILDSIFSGLEYQSQTRSKARPPIPSLKKYPSLQWAILGGISKEFAAGGLRIGYGISSSPDVNAAWNLRYHSYPHSTLLYALKKVYQQLIDCDPELQEALKQQKETLRLRAKELSKVLMKTGWTPFPSSGGLFISATPSKPPKAKRDFAKYLREATGIVINPPEWTGIPDHYRFVLSTTESDFKEAIRRLSSHSISNV